MSNPYQRAATSDEETFRPSKIKEFLMFSGALAFVAGSYFFWKPSPGDEWKRMSCMAFFGILSVVGVLQLLPGCSFLKISPVGVTIRSLWRTSHYQWVDLECFGVADVFTGHGWHKMVGFNFSETFPGRGKLGRGLAVSRGLSGFESALPGDYGWKVEELAEHLNQLRARYKSKVEGE